MCRQTGFEGKKRLAAVYVLRHAMHSCMAGCYCSASTCAAAQMYLVHHRLLFTARACLEHAKLQSASGHQHKSAVTVSVVQICKVKCEWCCHHTRVTVGTALVRFGRDSAVILEQPRLKVCV